MKTKILFFIFFAMLSMFLYATNVNAQNVNITINPPIPYSACYGIGFNYSSAGYSGLYLLNYNVSYGLTNINDTSVASFTLYMDQNGTYSQINLPTGYDCNTISSNLTSSDTVVSFNSGSVDIIANLNIMSLINFDYAQYYCYFNGAYWTPLFPDTELIYPIYNPITHTNTNVQATIDSNIQPSVLFSSALDPYMVVPAESGRLFYVSSSEAPVYIGKVPGASSLTPISQLSVNYFGDGSLSVVTAQGSDFAFGSMGTMAGKLIWNTSLPQPSKPADLGNVTSMKVWFNSNETSIQILAGFSSGTIEYYNGTSWSKLTVCQGGAVDFLSALWINNQNPCFVAQTAGGFVVYSGLLGQQSIVVTGDISSVKWNAFGFCKIYGVNRTGMASYTIDTEEENMGFNANLLSISAINSQTGETLPSPYSIYNFALNSNNENYMLTAYYLQNGSIYKLTTGGYSINSQLNEAELNNINIQNLDTSFGFVAATVVNVIPTDSPGCFIYTTNNNGINSISYNAVKYPALPSATVWPISIYPISSMSDAELSKLSNSGNLPDLMVVDDNSIPYFYSNGAWQTLSAIPAGYSIIGYDSLVTPYTPIAVSPTAPNILWNNFNNTYSNTWVNLIDNGGIPTGDDITAYYAIGTGVGNSSNVVYSYQSQTTKNIFCTNIDITENDGEVVQTGFSQICSGPMATLPSVQKITAYNQNGNFYIIAALSSILNGSNIWFYNGTSWSPITEVSDSSASFINLYSNWSFTSQNGIPELTVLMSDNSVFYYNPSSNTWAQFTLPSSTQTQRSINKLNITWPQIGNANMPLIAYTVEGTTTISGIMQLC